MTGHLNLEVNGTVPSTQLVFPGFSAISFFAGASGKVQTFDLRIVSWVLHDCAIGISPLIWITWQSNE